ncbi:SGNH/GDSL hydrolase family protein [Actinoplanes sp. NBRC 101535]|uniref:SGNH/GDSL hydrolase family protein n=1 Tax=Actinoplanes sp. NBRC 101535 TaxID=3032196 RepID=UPI0024A22D33|nr:SGNH/GDSL hydrolase family protein [Actinoplanes sp. NBRC 101535]GLY03111.1 SGNH hydrolase [Actinoplanes sp. NBRC 101535]
MNPLWMPVIAAQALWLRSTLQPATDPGGGTSGTAPGPAGTPLRLAVVGDSTAAGCGAAGDEEAFAAGFARELATRTGQPVDWRVVGQYGATARRIRHRLVPQLGDRLDMVVLLAGVNDVMAGRGPDQWHDDLTGILDDLVTRTARVVVAGLPPIDRIPVVPARLAHYLGDRAAALDAVSRQVCARNPERTTFAGASTGAPPPGFFGADRFHPSSLGYRWWAQEVAALTIID